jgi:SAM-dependent methyltransferase
LNADYWKRLHADVGDDLAVVNYPALPPAFNTLVDRIFAAAVLDAVDGLPKGRAAEIGCGRGRWLARLRGLGWRAFGMDVAVSARPQILGSAARPPFRSASLDLVLAVTVLQHMPEGQAEAVDGVARALRPGGHFLLLEVIDRPGVSWQAHMYPRSAEYWRETIRKAGLHIVRETSVEHLPLVRLIERVRVRRPARDESEMKAPSPRTPSAVKSLAWNAITAASRLIEPCWRLGFPESGSHRLFLARRDD